MAFDISPNESAHRYELHEDGELACIAEFRQTDRLVDIYHVETLPGFERRRIASTLITHVLNGLRTANMSVRPTCPFVSAFIRTHRDFVDLVPESMRDEFELNLN